MDKKDLSYFLGLECKVILNNNCELKGIVELKDNIILIGYEGIAKAVIPIDEIKEIRTLKS